jgi:hypothetical protein
MKVLIQLIDDKNLERFEKKKSKGKKVTYKKWAK